MAILHMLPQEYINIEFKIKTNYNEARDAVTLIQTQNFILSSSNIKNMIETFLDNKPKINKDKLNCLRCVLKLCFPSEY